MLSVRKKRICNELFHIVKYRGMLFALGDQGTQVKYYTQRIQSYSSSLRSGHTELKETLSKVLAKMEFSWLTFTLMDEHKFAKYIYDNNLSFIDVMKLGTTNEVIEAFLIFADYGKNHVDLILNGLYVREIMVRFPSYQTQIAMAYPTQVWDNYRESQALNAHVFAREVPLRYLATALLNKTDCIYLWLGHPSNVNNHFNDFVHTVMERVIAEKPTSVTAVDSTLEFLSYLRYDEIKFSAYAPEIVIMMSTEQRKRLFTNGVPFQEYPLIKELKTLGRNSRENNKGDVSPYTGGVIREEDSGLNTDRELGGGIALAIMYYFENGGNEHELNSCISAAVNRYKTIKEEVKD